MDFVTSLFITVTSFIRSRFDRTERGASLVEYALLVALIAVICIGALQFLGGSAEDKFSDVGSSVNGS